MEKILICWNDTEYLRTIKKEIENITEVKKKRQVHKYAVELFYDKDSLSAITQKADYIIILCELLWSHDDNSAPCYSEMNGIKLAQHLRREENIRIPILFVSFLSRKYIIQHPDAKIINTPALKHEFYRLPSNPTEWLNELKKMSGKMSELDLIYTKRRFCGIVGLLEQIRHDVSSCWTKELLKEKLKEIQYANNHTDLSFKRKISSLEDQIELLQKEANNKKRADKTYVVVHNKFKELCTIAISYIQEEGKHDVEITQEDKYKILYLEDDYSKENVIDSRIKHFIEAMENQDLNVKHISQPNYNQHFLRNSDSTNKYNAIICDIEIWEKNDEVRKLTCLGFDYIQKLSNTYHLPVYIILSNVTRSLHSSILNNLNVQVNMYSKSDVLASDSTIQVFIDGIRNLIKQKKGIAEFIDIQPKEKSNFLAGFKCLRDYIYIPSDYYPITIKKSNKTYETPSDVEIFIEQEYNRLQKIFDDKYKQQGIVKEKFLSDHIKGFRELSRLDFHKEKNKSKISDNDNIDKFIKILITRRLLFYAMLKHNIPNAYKLFTTEKNKIFLQNVLFLPEETVRKNVWNNNKNNIQSDFVKFLTKQEIIFIKDFMEK
ncbi:hypothetical protein [Parabacteroides sp. PF5-9]|uniref:hypothetical protein n=1 Tax=Parabacteroides sp. PF5-9 TaxID=1742404 RepID=UPI002476392E|nr:hypothetical protein [Parabacteroides sp. PF5-9]MDH6357782.1 CheY-like chemotaxis protein [Parabacteroides sp. PF5-9]